MVRGEERLPHDRGHLLWDSGVATPRLIESMDRWIENLLLDDGQSVVPNTGEHTVAKLFCKSEGVLAGRDVVRRLLEKYGIEATWHVEDGGKINLGILAELEGAKDTLLALERTILNLLARLSGVASNTAEWVDVAGCQVACTRKTTWGLLDKWAVHLGGGLTHRLDKNDALMLKENDLVSMDSIESALSSIDPREWGFVEIEVRTVEQAVSAANSWKHSDSLVIMLDNMSLEEQVVVKNALPTDNLILEASGGISVENVGSFTSVDVISASALNQGVPHLDMSIIFEGVD